MLNIFTNTDKIIDLCGLRCPEPLMIARQTIRNLMDGQTLYIIADDPATTRDIPNFCRYMNHTLLAQHTEHVPYHYLICKGNKL